MNNTKQETTRQLAWPRAQVQAEWSLLSRCLEDSVYLPTQSLDDQVKAIEMAIKHGVGPLLYHRLKVANSNGSLTKLAEGRLKQEYFQTAAFNLLLSSEIPSLAQRFAEAPRVHSAQVPRGPPRNPHVKPHGSPRTLARLVSPNPLGVGAQPRLTQNVVQSMRLPKTRHCV